ncbi:hypothetical protein Tco_1105970 [Tanacetum coccineum]
MCPSDAHYNSGKQFLDNIACSRVFTWDIYGDHVVSCAGIIGIKYRHNVVRDTLVDICYRPGISAGLDVCVDLTGSSPLTQTRMADFVPGRTVIDNVNVLSIWLSVQLLDMGFFPFFSSFGELEEDTVTLLKRIRKFSMVQDIGGRATIHIFNMTSFAIAKGRVAKTIGLMDAIAKINDPQCELLLLRSCTGISRLYFTMRTCPPRVFESAQRSFDVALRSSLERIVTASGSGFSDWQWRLTTLPFAFGGLDSAGLQTKLLRHIGIVSPGPIFDDALSVHNTSMETDLLSNPSEIAALKLIKKMTDIYFTRVTKNAESTFSLSPRQMTLWTSQREDHTYAWFRTVPISGLGQTMNSKTYRCVLCYRLGIPLFSVLKPCSSCSRVFAGDIYGDHVVSCAGIIGIKHRHNIVRDTLVDIYYRSEISHDIYFTRVTKDAKSSFSLSPPQMALWQSQREDHTSDWLRVVPISGLGQTMNGKTYRCVLCYRLGVPLFSVSKPCSACSKVFTGDVYGDHAVSCAGVIGIKHRHNTVRDTLIDICSRSGISAGKEVDIGLGGDGDKALRPADMLLYSWEGGLDVCVDLTGSSPLTQTGMTDFVPGRVVIDAAQRKRGKYMTKCADIGYGFPPFSFSSFGELEKDVVTLLKRVRKFSMAQDIGARAAVHIFNRISFSIAKGVGAQIVYRLPSNFDVNIFPGRAVIDAANHKRAKYEAKCANIGYGFLLFSFSSLGELEKDAVNILKRIRKFFVTQDIGARAAVHIFNRISFAVAK